MSVRLTVIVSVDEQSVEQAENWIDFAFEEVMENHEAPNIELTDILFVDKDPD